MKRLQKDNSRDNKWIVDVKTETRSLQKCSQGEQKKPPVKFLPTTCRRIVQNTQMSYQIYCHCIYTPSNTDNYIYIQLTTKCTYVGTIHYMYILGKYF